MPPGHPSQGPRGGPQGPAPQPVLTPPVVAPPVVEVPAPAPEVPSDAYHPELMDYGTGDTGLRGEAPGVRRPVSELTPNLRQVRTLPDVQHRFASDYQMVARDLVNVRDSDAPERASRTFEYFSKYAERFVELTTGEEKPQGEPGNGEQPEGAGRPLKEGKLPRLPEGTPESVLEGKPEETGEEPPAGKKEDRLSRLARLELLGPEQARLTPEQARALAEGKKLPEDPALLQRLREQAPLPVYTERDKQAFAQQFAQSLKDLSFEQLRDARTGRDGVTVAHELLTSASLKELQQKLEKVKITAQEWPPAPPTPKSEALVKEQAQPRRSAQEFTGAPLAYKDIGESPGKLSNLQPREHARDGVELRVNTLAAESAKVVVKSPELEQQSNPMGTETDARRRGGKKLGSHTLWNVLHTYRQEGADSATEKARWDRMAFGAMLFLVLTTLVAIVLVSM